MIASRWSSSSCIQSASSQLLVTMIVSLLARTVLPRLVGTAQLQVSAGLRWEVLIAIPVLKQEHFYTELSKIVVELHAFLSPRTKLTSSFTAGTISSKRPCYCTRKLCLTWFHMDAMQHDFLETSMLLNEETCVSRGFIWRNAAMQSQCVSLSDSVWAIRDSNIEKKIPEAVFPHLFRWAIFAKRLREVNVESRQTKRLHILN